MVSVCILFFPDAMGKSLGCCFATLGSWVCFGFVLSLWLEVCGLHKGWRMESGRSI